MFRNYDMYNACQKSKYSYSSGRGNINGGAGCTRSPEEVMRTRQLPTEWRFILAVNPGLSRLLISASLQAVSHNEHHAPSFLDDMDKGEEEKLLGMLHVPILHGGVREVLLLSSLSTDSGLTFTLACIILVVCATLLELFRLLSWWVENKYSGGSSGMGSSCGCKQCNSLTAWWVSWISIGLLQFFVYVFSTFLMLIAMTMNIYLIISMAFGSMFGKMTVVLLKKKLMEAHK
ncbi:uncharacterized protein LOC135220643 isoform X2 [Macrobrachium nipponense]|uniref:uncharacterized protein LOC135220643 isoform X2 n=1 Tax=Macrobrachium nipponense TaxID=159736 RepID=UPI0030C853CF